MKLHSQWLTTALLTSIMLTAVTSADAASAVNAPNSSASNTVPTTSAIIIPPTRPPVMYPDTYQSNNFGNSLLIDEHSPAVTYGQVTLEGLNLNNAGNTITVSPGQLIPATVVYVYDCPTCKQDSINQIIIGLDKLGAQACLYNGSTQGKGISDFMLTAPTKPGTYDIRFRYAQAWGCSDAIKNWWKVDQTPPASASVGTIIVK